VLEALAETHGGGGLALAERGGGDGADQHVLGAWCVGQLVDGGQPDLHDVPAVRLEQLGRQPHVTGDVLDGLELRAPRDLQVGRESHG
jgi:hypothetical protein